MGKHKTSQESVPAKTWPREEDHFPNPPAIAVVPGDLLSESSGIYIVSEGCRPASMVLDPSASFLLLASPMTVVFMCCCVSSFGRFPGIREVHLLRTWERSREATLPPLEWGRRG